MATIGPVSLAVAINVANADITCTYSLTGSAFDVASGQPYLEVCKLVGDDTGIVPAEDNTDDNIVNGLLTPIFNFPVVFTSTASIARTRTKTIAKSNLDEDVGTDEIRAVVTLTPLPPSASSRESNQVTGSF